jgi:hypothetical protein
MTPWRPDVRALHIRTLHGRVAASVSAIYRPGLQPGPSPAPVKKAQAIRWIRNLGFDLARAY